VVVRGLAVMGMAVLIFISCVTFIQADFMFSPVWWILFFSLGISEFISLLGLYSNNSQLNFIGTLAMSIIIAFSFIYFWWQGGAGMLLGFFLWVMFLTPLVNLFIKKR
jgi:hypothetical protein